MKKLVLVFVVALLAIAITACPKNETPTPADFSLTASSLTITIGQSGTTTITITRTGGFADLVALTLNGQPEGVTAVFNPTSANMTGVLTLNVDNTVVAGNYPLTVIGTAAGKTHNSPAFTLTVKKVVDNGAFELAATAVTITKDSVSPNDIGPQVSNTVYGGESTITISRKNNFSGAIHLATQDLPPGVTSTFTTNDTTGNSSTLKLTVAANVAEGTHQITVKGTSGAKTAIATFVLTIKKKENNGSFTLEATDVSIEIQPVSISPQGGVIASGSSDITITRTNGFKGDVYLTVPEFPKGVSGKFSPNPVVANKSTLRLEINNNASLGSEDIAIEGKSGAITSSTIFNLTIKFAGDTTAPTIVNTSPAHNAHGVLMDAKIIISFSEAMDKTATEAAFSSTNIIPKSFSWSNGDKTMTVEPNHELGYSPNENYRTYSFSIGTGAKDVAGNHMEFPQAYMFTTFRTFQKKLISEPGLDGIVTSDGYVVTTAKVLPIGDINTKESQRGFLSFDLSAIDAKATKVIVSIIGLHQQRSVGHPYQVLGKVLISLHDYGTKLEAKDYNFPIPRRPVMILSDTVADDWKTLDVTDWVQNSLDNRSSRHNKSQFMFYFPTDTNGDNKQDMVWFYSAEYGVGSSYAQYRPYLIIKYLAP